MKNRLLLPWLIAASWRLIQEDGREAPTIDSSLRWCPGLLKGFLITVTATFQYHRSLLLQWLRCNEYRRDAILKKAGTSAVPPCVWKVCAEPFTGFWSEGRTRSCGLPCPCRARGLDVLINVVSDGTRTKKRVPNGRIRRLSVGLQRRRSAPRTSELSPAHRTAKLSHPCGPTTGNSYRGNRPCFDQNHQSKAAVIDSVAEELGGLDGFINNVGTGDGIKFLNLDIETWTKTLDSNLNGAFVCMQAAARRMVNAGTGGRIVAVISVHEFQPRVGAAACEA